MQGYKRSKNDSNDVEDASRLHSCTHAVDPIAGNEVIPLNTSYRNWKVTCNG